MLLTFLVLKDPHFKNELENLSYGEVLQVQ